MTVTQQIPKLSEGFVALYDSVSDLETFADAADLWAEAYVNWLVEGGIRAARTRTGILSSGWTAAFSAPTQADTLNGFYATLVLFWAPGLPVPSGSTAGQGAFPATTIGYVPASIPIVNPAFESSDTQELADGLANFVSSITLPLVTITVAASPPYVAPLTP